jgi:hypothetical protein
MLSAFDNCPWKGFRMYIAKDLAKTNDSKRDWGNTLHKAFSMYITRGRALPREAIKYAPTLAPLQAQKPFTELPLAVRRDGSPCGFFDDGVFVRGYGDVVMLRGPMALILDFKSGKKREDSAELRLHSMMLRAAHPELERVLGQYIWLQHVDMGLSPMGQQHDVSDTVATWAYVEQAMDEIEHMLTNNHFPKQPNPLCGWCPVMDCEHNKVSERNGT